VDDEPEGDDEPSLGSTASGPSERTSQEYWAEGNRDDREHDDGETGIADMDGLQEQTNGEPDLGSIDAEFDQRKSWRVTDSWFANLDREEDTADNEPSLGWPDGRISQGFGSNGGTDDRELDAADQGERDEHY
jgi:hypothetical protein